MIFRAIFWLAVVALLMPHGGGAGAAPDCHRASCSAGAQFLDRIKDAGLHSLVRVRADIKTAERARNHAAG
ncbi:MAG: hypothetical protein JO056_09575 [Alphaproteobacteria bacterium]|nr:hypothetical protein [Alphaproteobacteria bacterium]